MFKTAYRSARVVNAAQVAALFAFCLSPAAAAESYSPNVDDAYPDTVYWGDTHVHTYLSGDAFAFGCRLTPDDAYRFAKGEDVQSTGGEPVRLRRPLDFLMVADHAENLGVLPLLAANPASLPETENARSSAQIIAEVRPLPDILNAETAEAYSSMGSAMGAAKAAWQMDYGIDEDFRRDMWSEVVRVAEKHNAPGAFTTFVGYEWTARAGAGRSMIHRNVLYGDGPALTEQTSPFSRFDSDNPEDLWAHLEDYEERLGGNVISIPHNGNLSGGQMFSPSDYEGRPLTPSYARTRARFEPVVEATQFKGDSETHPLVSSNDTFADFERWGPWGAAASSGAKAQAKPPTTEKAPAKAQQPPEDIVASARQSYARSALGIGLDLAVELGVNPFKFGMIGSTDSHTGLATADEDNFWGKMGYNEPSRFRAFSSSIYAASGYAAVWARENTRPALFAAMKRREVYATTGPRITVRFFAGWDFVADDAVSPRLAAAGYRKGVPMGGDLTVAPEGKAPSFLVRAVKDPGGANLDRVQVVKGWRDSAGEMSERVYDVALSDGRMAGADGRSAEPVGDTVDIRNATYLNSIGAVELSAVWRDPDFDPDAAAFYYVRVLQIPTPRWTAYDARFYQLDVSEIPEEQPVVIQERAYTSPIWYTPQ